MKKANIVFKILMIAAFVSLFFIKLKHFLTSYKIERRRIMFGPRYKNGDMVRVVNSAARCYGHIGTVYQYIKKNQLYLINFGSDDDPSIISYKEYDLESIDLD